METIKNFFRRFTQTTPFVLANTLVIVPYLLFIHLIHSSIAMTAMPFVLFYTFRVTGIFLIRGLHRSIDQYTLLMVALLIGGFGAFLTLLGTIYFSSYLFGSILLGLSAAWLPAANTSVNFYEQTQGFRSTTSKGYLYALIVLAPLGFGLTASLPLQMVVVPSMITLYYICAYHTVKHYPHYEMDFKELPKHVFSIPELIWFVLFFSALFLLRSGRLLFNEKLVDGSIILFASIFILAIVVIHQVKDRWKLPLWQNALTFLNGMIGNFIFLFGAFYITVYKGSAAQGLYLFLPYVLATISALLVAGKLRKKAKNPLVFQLFGLMIGLLLLSIRSIFPLAIFVLTFFQKSTSSWLNRLYYQTDSIPEQQRITAKYSTSNKGSITHQFILMFLLGATLWEKELPIRDLFLLKNLHTQAIFGTMDLVKFATIVLLLAGIYIVGRMGKDAFNH